MVDDENGQNVFDDWESKAPGKFQQYLLDKWASLEIPFVDERGSFTTTAIGALASSPRFKQDVATIESATDLPTMLVKMLDTFPRLMEGWKTKDRTKIAELITTFIATTTLKKLVHYYSDDREANYMRKNSKMVAALFLNTLGKRIYPIDNLAELNVVLMQYLGANGLLEETLYARFRKIEEKESKGSSLSYQEQSLKNEVAQLLQNPRPAALYAYKLYGLMVNNTGAIIKHARQYEIPIEHNLQLLAAGGKSGTSHANAFMNKLHEVKKVLERTTPNNIGKLTGGRRPWPAYEEMDVDFHYFEVELSPSGLKILLNDNFSYLMQIVPDLVARLMDLEDLRPLNASKLMHKEFDGGDVDLEYTVKQWITRGELRVYERKVEKFKEKDKANMALILDRSGSMGRADAEVCSRCGAHAQLKCGHGAFVPTPMFRYCQFLLTILAWIFKDHVNNFLLGFIDSNGTEIKEYSPDEVEDLMHDVWNCFEGSGTNFYALGWLKERFPDFFAGRNKKFLFVITDGLLEDVLPDSSHWGQGKLFDYMGKSVNAFPLLNEFARDENLNFIYLPIAPPDKNSMQNSGLGFRVAEENNAFNCITRFRIRLHLVKMVEDNPNYITELKRMRSAKDSFRVINGKLVVTQMETFLAALEEMIRYNSVRGQVTNKVLAYTIFFYKYYEKCFFSDSYKLGFVGELQRLVHMIKQNNFLSLAEGW